MLKNFNEKLKDITQKLDKKTELSVDKFVNNGRVDITIPFHDDIYIGDIILYSSNYDLNVLKGLLDSGFNFNRGHIDIIYEKDNTLFEEMLKYSYIYNFTMNYDIPISLITKKSKYIELYINNTPTIYLKKYSYGDISQILNSIEKDELRERFFNKLSLQFINKTTLEDIIEYSKSVKYVDKTFKSSKLFLMREELFNLTSENVNELEEQQLFNLLKNKHNSDKFKIDIIKKLNDEKLFDIYYYMFSTNQDISIFDSVKDRIFKNIDRDNFIKILGFISRSFTTPGFNNNIFRVLRDRIKENDRKFIEISLISIVNRLATQKVISPLPKEMLREMFDVIKESSLFRFKHINNKKVDQFVLRSISKFLSEVYESKYDWGLIVTEQDVELIADHVDSIQHPFIYMNDMIEDNIKLINKLYKDYGNYIFESLKDIDIEKDDNTIDKSELYNLLKYYNMLNSNIPLSILYENKPFHSYSLKKIIDRNKKIDIGENNV